MKNSADKRESSALRNRGGIGQFEGRARKLRKCTVSISSEKRDGIVALIGDGEVQKTVTVEVRDDQRSWIIPNSKRRSRRFRKNSVGFASGVSTPQQHRDIVRSEIHQNHIGRLAGGKLFAVVAENTGANSDLTTFVGAQCDRRCSDLNEVSIVLILQDHKGVGLRIVENHR